MPQIRVHDIAHRRRSITADTALRIGRALGTTPDFWLDLQRVYDLELARAKTDVSGIESLVDTGADLMGSLGHKVKIEGDTFTTGLNWDACAR